MLFKVNLDLATTQLSVTPVTSRHMEREASTVRRRHPLNLRASRDSRRPPRQEARPVTSTDQVERPLRLVQPYVHCKNINFSLSNCTFQERHRVTA